MSYLVHLLPEIFASVSTYLSSKEFSFLFDSQPEIKTKFKRCSRYWTTLFQTKISEDFQISKFMKITPLYQMFYVNLMELFDRLCDPSFKDLNNDKQLHIEETFFIWLGDVNGLKFLNHVESRITMKSLFYDYVVHQAATYGYTSLFFYTYPKSGKVLHELVHPGFKNGNSEIVEFLFKEEKSRDTFPISSACDGAIEGGHLSLFNEIVDRKHLMKHHYIYLALRFCYPTLLEELLLLGSWTESDYAHFFSYAACGLLVVRRNFVILNSKYKQAESNDLDSSIFLKDSRGRTEDEAINDQIKIINRILEFNFMDNGAGLSVIVKAGVLSLVDRCLSEPSKVGSILASMMIAAESGHVDIFERLSKTSKKEKFSYGGGYDFSHWYKECLRVAARSILRDGKTEDKIRMCQMLIPFVSLDARKGIMDNIKPEVKDPTDAITFFEKTKIEDAGENFDLLTKIFQLRD